jgi:predicted phosphodiesterase
MKLHVLSDLHLEFADFDIPPTGADAVILAGDIHVGDQGVRWALKALPDTPVIYVPGNHEYYDHNLPELSGQLKRETEGTRVHVLDNDSAVIGGVRFLGCTLWSDFHLYGNAALAGFRAQQSLADYRAIWFNPESRPLHPADTAALHDESRAWLAEQLAGTERPTVVVTHHAPATPSIAERFRDEPLNPAFVSNLDAMVADSGAALWVHGHTHDAFDYRLGDTRVVCNPRGYPKENVAGFDPARTVTLD